MARPAPLLALALGLGASCGDGGAPVGIDAPAAPADGRAAAADALPDAPALDGPLAACTPAVTAKIRFSQAEGCLNDGSVEFCVPAADTALRATIASLAPTITCAPGGGRAGCLGAPGLLLCMYPTEVPAECVVRHGAMTDAAWGTLCAIATSPAISEIVATWYE